MFCTVTARLTNLFEHEVKDVNKHFTGKQIHWPTNMKRCWHLCWLKWSGGRSVVSDSLWTYGLYSPWNSPGQNTGVGGHSLLQGIFPTQGSNPGLLHCRCILYQLSHKGSPRILEWVAYPVSRGSSTPRNWTGLSCIAGRFFTNWAIREALIVIKLIQIKITTTY